jgi:predicted esterase
VLVVQEITAQWAKAMAWSGTNLQYPDLVAEPRFRVVPGEPPSIQLQITWPKGSKEIDTFTYDAEKNQLIGWTRHPGDNAAYGPWVLTRDQSFYVYKDYARYLTSKSIYSKTHPDSLLQRYGQGYLVYLPDGYATDSNRTWPLILFLHGAGDRGNNVFLLAKASPFMYIREKGPLPFIIVAPLLNTYPNYASFPEEYMDGVLAQARTDFRIDPKRIYVTGLSMGGEAAYRLALHQPDTFAAVAPLSAFFDNSVAAAMTSLQDLPVWAIHGADDTVVPLARAQQTVNALKEAGGNVRFSVLQGHDHDVWTDTYSDPAFYDWFLQHQRP